MPPKKPPLAEIDPHALALLVDIIDAGSLSAAARRKNTSRSAVSHRLKALEDALGLQLLRRTTRRIEPTEIGRRLYERGLAIASELAQARAEAEAVGESPRGTVRLSVPTGLGDALIGGLLLEFKRSYPEVALEVVFKTPVFDLLAEEIDVAVCIIASPPEQLRAIELGQVDWLLCAAPSYLRRTGTPTTAQQLQGRDIVSSIAFRGTLVATGPRMREPARIAVQPHLRSDNFSFVKQAIVAGLGIGLLPFYQVEPELRARRLVGVLGDHHFAVTGQRAILLAVPDRFRTPAIRTLIDFLKNRVSEEMAALRSRYRAAGFAVAPGSKAQ